jgi:hypothetical protein
VVENLCSGFTLLFVGSKRVFLCLDMCHLQEANLNDAMGVLNTIQWLVSLDIIFDICLFSLDCLGGLLTRVSGYRS